MGETYDEYLHDFPQWPTQTRSKIYLVKIGDNEADEIENPIFKQFCKTYFFGIGVEVLPNYSSVDALRNLQT